MTDEQFLSFDLDNLDVGQITFLEMTLNRELRDLIAPEIVTFNDVVAQFRYSRGAKDPETGEAMGPPRLTIPTGPILQTLGLMQLRETNPDATWEDAGKLKLRIEVETPLADPVAMVGAAEEAARMPEDPMAILEAAATATFEPPVPEIHSPTESSMPSSSETTSTGS